MRSVRSLFTAAGRPTRRLRPVGRRIAAGGRRLQRPFRRIAADLLGLAPALIVAAGVFLIAAGLFNYLQPAEVQPTPSTSLVAPSASGPAFTIAPSGSFSSSSSAHPDAAVATRIVIQALKIDLPIVNSPQNERFPLCNAAEYFTLGKVFGYPGLPQATYLYAHARTGMFLPLLTASQRNDGPSMVGLTVEVYTADDQRHFYEITQVIRRVPPVSKSLDRPLGAKTDELWLQTSEGPHESSTKLQVLAMPFGVLAADHAAAHPTAQGNVCPDAPRCTAANQGGCRR